MPAYLADIVAAHRAAADTDRRDPEDLVERALRCTLPTRPFAAALGDRAGGGLAVVAEVKRRSPSKGDLAPDLDPAEVAVDYAAGGAACLSVLTDREYFGGSPEDLAAARAACDLPVLRKDFIVAAADVCDARLMGADAVLLIVAALADDELATLADLAARLSLDALVEVHDHAELARALDAGATLVGVNQRDLATFTVDPERAAGLVGAIPDGVVAVAESGIAGPADAARLAAAGFEAVLVGESLVRSGDRKAAVAAIVGHPVGRRGAAGDRPGGAERPLAGNLPS
jgi:indole-3-glycerol phosphate synthase